MDPDPAIVDEMVRRMVEAAHPLRIVLFGSAARGEMGPNSDLDTLVVVPNDRDCHEVNTLLIRSLRGLRCPTDIVVVRQADVEQYGDNPYLIIHTALSQGKELYRAALPPVSQHPDGAASDLFDLPDPATLRP
jgi:predicted nucleotidyltransferase